MSTLRTLKKLILGETWILPIGLATTLTTGVLVVLLASVNRTARRR